MLFTIVFFRFYSTSDELDSTILQKKSGLTPKEYQIGLSAFLKLIGPTEIIN